MLKKSYFSLFFSRLLLSSSSSTPFLSYIDLFYREEAIRTLLTILCRPLGSVSVRPSSSKSSLSTASFPFFFFSLFSFFSRDLLYFLLFVLLLKLSIASMSRQSGQNGASGKPETDDRRHRDRWHCLLPKLSNKFSRRSQDEMNEFSLLYPPTATVTVTVTATVTPPSPTPFFLSFSFSLFLSFIDRKTKGNSFPPSILSYWIGRFIDGKWLLVLLLLLPAEEKKRISLDSLTWKLPRLVLVLVTYDRKVVALLQLC